MGFQFIGENQMGYLHLVVRYKHFLKKKVRQRSYGPFLVVQQLSVMLSSCGSI